MSDYKVAVIISFNANRLVNRDYQSRQNDIARTVIAFLSAVTGLEPSELEIEMLDLIHSDRLDEGDVGSAIESVVL